MKKNDLIFIYFGLSLTSVFLLFYAFVAPVILKGVDQRIQVDHLETELKNQGAELEHLRNAYEELRTSSLEAVSENLTAKNSKKLLEFKDLRAQSIVSSLRTPASTLSEPMSRVEFEKIKLDFKNKDYLNTVYKSEAFLKKFNLSVYLPEVHYYLVEAYYLLGERKKSLDFIDKMIAQYPDHELTGFAMIRMGQMSSAQPSVAREIYKIVKETFKSRLVAQKLSEVQQK